MGSEYIIALSKKYSDPIFTFLITTNTSKRFGVTGLVVTQNTMLAIGQQSKRKRGVIVSSLDK